MDCNNYTLNGNLYILDDLTAQNTNDAIGDVQTIIEDMPYRKPHKLKIASPISINKGVFDIYINSYGGHEKTYFALKYLLSIAKSKNIIIRTHVMGIAGTYSSLIALQGTPGFRIMYEQAYHYSPLKQQKPTIGFTKQDKADEQTSLLSKNRKETLISEYTALTDLTPEQIDTFFKKGEMNYEECLKNNMCDWVLRNDGLWIFNQQKHNKKQR